MVLKQKRILITYIDFENELHLEILQKLLAADAIVFVFLREFAHYDKLAEKFPSALPFLADMSRDDGGEPHVTKLISYLPSPAHIINMTTGSVFNKSLNKAGIAYKYKAEDLSYDLGAKEIVKKLLEAGNACLLLNFQAEILSKNLSEAIKEKVSVTLNESKKSFRRMFSLGSSSGSSQAAKVEVSPSLSAPATFSQPQREFKSKRLEEKLSLQEPTKFKENQTRILQLENEKVIKVIHKLVEKSRKKYGEMEKGLEKKQSSKDKEVVRSIKSEQKKEKNHLLQQNAEANAQTMSRSGALSAETANKIVASRNARVDKEVERNAEKKYKQAQEIIATEITDMKSAMIEKHYKYLAEKQVKKLQELQQSLCKLS